MNQDVAQIKCAPGIILIEPIDPPKEFNGISRPDEVKQKSQEGKVIDFSWNSNNPEQSIFAEKISIGDTIIFREWTGTQYKLNGKTYLFLDFKDVKGIIPHG